jgi:putative glutamine amidotransferase
MSYTPIIGITLDIENMPSYAHEPWYALRENYCSSIRQAKGLPIGIPHEIKDVDKYLDLVDGLVISGGMYDIDPTLYGDIERDGDLVKKSSRTEFELTLVRGALARDIPLVGICGGMQILAVIKGAKLIQDINTEVPNSLNHMQPLPHSEPSQLVKLTSGSKIAGFFDEQTINVNSVHHQSIKNLPAEIVVSGVAEDGVIEAIEIPDQTFCLGFQWHPEYLISKGELNMFEGFIAAASNRRSHK